MSPPSKKKKRSHGGAESFAIVEAEDTLQDFSHTKTAAPNSLVAKTTTTSMIANTSTSETAAMANPLPAFVLEQQIESLKVELEHEQSLRSLDQRRFQHAKERLEKQVEIAMEEAREASKSLEDFRRQSDKMMEQLRQSRNQAMTDLRKCQIDHLYSVSPAGSGVEDDDKDNDYHHNAQEDQKVRAHQTASSMSNVWKNKCRYLEQLLENQRASEEELKKRFASLREDVEARTKQATTPTRDWSGLGGDNRAVVPLLENAPPAVMKELNRERIQKAESERRERQLTIQIQELQRRNQGLVQEREEAKLAQERLPIVQEQLEHLQKEYETLAAQHKAWNEFGTCLETLIVLPEQSSQTTPTTKKDDDRSEMVTTTTPRPRKGPPELSTMQRFLQDSKSRISNLEQQNETLHSQNKELKAAALPLELQIKELAQAERVVLREKRDVERKLNLCQRQVTQLETQETIHRREIENLQTLIKTLDDLPLVSASSSSKVSSSRGGSDPVQSNHSQQTMEISLASARDELKVLQDEKERLLKESEETQTELERVKEKFGKLRDALQAERAKAEQAEQRAHEAENLAGKGSYNPETTRVLHFQETPLVQSLKEEIKVLQRQVEVANSSSSASKRTAAAHDPAKLNQRLKENFKEQIAVFREGVYLMTGFKVDMLPGTDRPTFRVRSMYAEQEEDHLILKWPKSEDVTSLDILNTDLAKVLAKSPSYDYMTKFHSLPAFLASAQLSWFEKQTVMV